MAKADCDRVPPHNLEAEVAVLGAILLEPKAILAALPILEPAHFYRADHQKIYAAFLKLHAEKTSLDVVTVKKALHELGADDIAGNADLFMTLGGAVPSVDNCRYYAQIVRDCWILRETIAAASDTLVRAYEQKEEPADVLRTAQSRMLGISRSAERREPQTLAALLGKVITEMMDGGKAEPAIPTGWPEVDGALGGGFRPGEFVIVGGRPSTGKSASIYNLCPRFLAQEAGTMIFSLEVNQEQLVRNILACASQVGTLGLRDGRLSKEEWDAIRRGAEKLYTDRCEIDEPFHLSPSELRSKAQWFALQKPLKVVVVDYLQLMDGDGGRGRNWTRLQELSEISRSLKLTAREIGVCVIALSQLNREITKADRPPRLSDLRECGSFEQDADTVILLHDRGDDADGAQPGMSRVDWIIAKQRNGPRDVTIPMLFKKKTLTFEPLSAYRAANEAVQDGGQDDLFEPR